MRNQNFCPLSHNSPASYAKRLCVPTGKFYIRNTIHSIKSFDKIHLLPIKSDKNITSVSSCDKEIHFARKLIKYHVLLVNKKPSAKRFAEGFLYVFCFLSSRISKGEPRVGIGRKRRRVYRYSTKSQKKK